MIWIDGGAADMAPETARRVDHAGTTYALLRGLAEGYSAVEGLCPHEEAHLVRGRVEGRVVECPRHGARFDIATGAARGRRMCRDLRVFATRIRKGRVEIHVPQD
ncbi:MAG: Rieske 2Fe-2S domain-containing protein [Pseudomonadota bacterium]